MVLSVFAWGAFFTPQAVQASDGGVPIIIQGGFEMVYNYTTTKSYVSCPPPEEYKIEKIQSSNTYNHITTFIIPASIKHLYNGSASHCLSKCQNWFWFARLNADGTITVFQQIKPKYTIDVENYYFNKLSTSQSAFGTFAENGTDLKFNLTITKTLDGYFAIVPYFPQSQAVNPDTAFGININIQIYDRDTEEFKVAYARKVNQKFIPSLPNGNYKFIVEPNQTFLTFNIPSSTECSTGYTINLKNNTLIEVDFSIENSSITNFEILSPTSLDNIIPEQPGSPYEHEELDITFPDYPSDDEEIEDTTFWGQLKRLVKFITGLFKSVGDFSQNIDPLVPLYKSWDKLKVKFPFCVINDMIELIPNAGYGCPVCFNCGTYNFGRGITGSFDIMKYICNIDQYLGSTFLTLIRSLLYAVIISPLVFIVYTSARNLFKNL